MDVYQIETTPKVYENMQKPMVYAELNDYLNRKDPFFYGYESQGIHFLVGVKYKF